MEILFSITRQQEEPYGQHQQSILAPTELLCNQTEILFSTILLIRQSGVPGQLATLVQTFIFKTMEIWSFIIQLSRLFGRQAHQPNVQVISNL
jgi:hypothetical protein